MTQCQIRILQRQNSLTLKKSTGEELGLKLKGPQMILVPTNLRGHHSDVMPRHVLPVQGLRGLHHSSARIDPEEPLVLIFGCHEIPGR